MPAKLTKEQNETWDRLKNGIPHEKAKVVHFGGTTPANNPMAGSLYLNDQGEYSVYTGSEWVKMQ